MKSQSTEELQGAMEGALCKTWPRDRSGVDWKTKEINRLKGKCINKQVKNVVYLAGSIISGNNTGDKCTRKTGLGE